ncbi:hypothetical protein FACS189490_14250 [Clostridia bacterium]|nr:hypothetical protein FACS189490_14250 [Clostridia bacterium]
MQAIMESIFDISYLITAAVFGILLLRKNERLFGIMTLLLAAGDAFHLVPRIIALNTDGIANHAASLGFGTLVTSITMTFFYALLYVAYRLRYKLFEKPKHSDRRIFTTVYILVLARIVLCLAPQNEWLSADAPYMWGIYRNIPFLVLGLLMVVIFFIKRSDKQFRFMWLAILLSFAFYIPVVLLADAYPLIGMLMLPKTIMYVWMIVMFYNSAKSKQGAVSGD